MVTCNVLTSILTSIDFVNISCWLRNVKNGCDSVSYNASFFGQGLKVWRNLWYKYLSQSFVEIQNVKLRQCVLGVM